MARTAIALGAGFLVLISAACAANRPQQGPEVGSASLDRQVQVENGTRVDLRITALYGTIRTPVGTVRTMDSRSLRIPRGVPDAVRLMGEPVGGSMADRLFSEPIYLSEGRQARWIIRSNGSSHVDYGRSPLRP
jgi:hypothetical protein